MAQNLYKMSKTYLSFNNAIQQLYYYIQMVAIIFIFELSGCQYYVLSSGTLSACILHFNN